MACIAMRDASGPVLLAPMTLAYSRERQRMILEKTQLMDTGELAGWPSFDSFLALIELFQRAILPFVSLPWDELYARS